MISIVLDIETNQRLRKSVHDSQTNASTCSHPLVLQVEEKSNVEKGTKIPSPCSEFSATTNDLENFSLDFSFKLRVKFVPVANDHRIP